MLYWPGSAGSVRNQCRMDGIEACGLWSYESIKDDKYNDDVCMCRRLMQKVQMQLMQLKHKIDVIVPEQEVLTESLEEVTCAFYSLLVQFCALCLTEVSSSELQQGLLSSASARLCCMQVENHVSLLRTVSIYKVYNCTYKTYTAVAYLTECVRKL